MGAYLSLNKSSVDEVTGLINYCLLMVGLRADLEKRYLHKGLTEN